MKNKINYFSLVLIIVALSLTACEKDGLTHMQEEISLIKEGTVTTVDTTLIDTTESENSVSDIELSETVIPVEDISDTDASETPIDSDVGFMGGVATEVTTIEEEVIQTSPIQDVVMVESDEHKRQPIQKGVGEEITTPYVYQTLTEREQRLYDEIKTAVINMLPTVNIVNNGYTEDEWNKAFCNVYYQETSLFWVDPYLVPGELYYKTTDVDDISYMKSEIDNVTTSILNGMSDLNNDLDRVKYIHDYLIRINDFKKNGGASYSPTIYGGLVSCNPQCEGYAKAFTYLCNKIGIESMVITGNVESGASHAWNKVKIDGDWYNIDLTHDDPILQTPSSKYIRYTYFLVPDSWILEISHFRQNLSQLYNSIEFYTAPQANCADFNYFNYYDSVFLSYEMARKELLQRMINAVNNKDVLVQIKVSDAQIYNQLKNDLVELKDITKEETGVAFSRVAASCDDEQYIVGVSFQY